MLNNFFLLGLAVTAPKTSTVVVAGAKTKITVSKYRCTFLNYHQLIKNYNE